MKIQFKRNVMVEVEKPKLEEVWDSSFPRWAELKIDSIIDCGESVNIYTAEGDVLLGVPKDAFVVL